MLIKKVKDKLDEYGLSILSHYKVEKSDKDYVFIIEEAVFFVREKEKSIGLSFQATTKPERAATLTLIASEIKRCSIFIMESFIFDEKREFISGEEAYKLIKNTQIEVAKDELSKEQMYNKILLVAEGYKC